MRAPKSSGAGHDAIISNDNVAAFLWFLSEDLSSNPGRAQPIDEGIVRRARKLIEGIAVDLSAPLTSEESPDAPGTPSFLEMFG